MVTKPNCLLNGIYRFKFIFQGPTPQYLYREKAMKRDGNTYEEKMKEDSKNKNNITTSY